MKKTISINIGGIIFHIEEEGFEVLKNYLSAITKYFSTYEDSKEIIADIENRIAEIFLAKLHADKQVITEEDVEVLKATMGTISDFEQASGNYASDYEETQSEEKEQHEYYTETAKKLYRDENRKLIGGVAAGVAHYFHIDPLWVRLLFLLSFFDFFSFFTITGVVLICYAVLWAIIPGSTELEEDSKVKHLFRNPDNKVMGGVASGISSYFGIDVTIVRVAFVLATILGGVGLVPYLIMWIITPEAKSLTERMQMEGEPITLENIERKIRESLNIKDGEEESPLAKVLLLPFRLISAFLNNFGKDVRPLASFLTKIIMVIVGGLMAASSAVATFGLIIAMGVILGFISTDMASIDMEGIPIELIQDTIPLASVFFTFLTAWVPVIFLGVLGVSLVARQPITKPSINWSLLGIWLIGIVGTAATVPVFAANFKAEGSKKQNVTYHTSGEQALSLFAKEMPSMGFNNVTVTIRGTEQPDLEIIQKFSARGTSRQNAIENTHYMNYQINQRDDSTLIFDMSFMLSKDATFRNQSLHMDMLMPFGKSFKMDESLLHIIRNTIYRSGYTEADVRVENLWKYERDGLKCLTCNNQFENHTYTSDDGKIIKKMELSEFSSIEVDGRIEAHIIQGEESFIKIIGTETAIEACEVNLANGILSVIGDFPNEVKVLIQTPTLRNLSATGFTEMFVKAQSVENLSLGLTDLSSCEMEIADINNLNIDLKDKTSIILSGKGNNFNLRARDASEADAVNFIASNVNIDAKDAAQVNAFARGNANVISKDGADVHIERASD